MADHALRPSPLARLGPLDAERARALRCAATVLLCSRALVWVAGVGADRLATRAPDAAGYDPAGLTAPFGAFGDALVAPAARWDSVWYLDIATHGYGGSRSAFFPLYPLLAAVAGAPVGSALVGGLVVSLAALLAALYVLHRLVSLDLGERAAAPALWAVALFPTSFVLSAVYPEALFLALSVGAIYAARRGRWASAGALGALAAATRSAGVLLLVPLAILYLYGPRADRAPDRPQARGLGPRHEPRADALWLALVPAGLGAYLAYLGNERGDALSPFHVQDVWFRHFAGPFGGAWDGVVAAYQGARQLLSGARTPIYFKAAGGDPYTAAFHNLFELAFLVLAVVLLVAALRRLPLAYGAYALAALALPLSYPVGPEPLMSLPRFLAVLFPLQVALGVWAGARRRRGIALAVAGAALLAWCTAGFATWHKFVV
jgi:hypothetical protein